MEVFKAERSGRSAGQVISRVNFKSLQVKKKKTVLKCVNASDVGVFGWRSWRELSRRSSPVDKEAEGYRVACRGGNSARITRETKGQREKVVLFSRWSRKKFRNLDGTKGGLLSS